MARRSRLEVLVEVAEDVGRALDAVRKLRSGKDGPAMATLARSVEREARRVLATRMRRKRQRRSTSGKFTA